MQHPSSWGFPLFSFQSFSSAHFSPCRRLHPLHLFHFPPIFHSHFCDSFLSSVSGVLFRLCDTVPDLISVSLSSRQMADLGVMVRCLGGVDSLQGGGFYISRHPVREKPSLLSASASSLCSSSLSLHTSNFFPHSNESLAFQLCIISVYICVWVCVFVPLCVCLFSDRMGFCGETAPRVRLGTDWCLSLHVLTH